MSEIDLITELVRITKEAHEEAKIVREEAEVVFVAARKASTLAKMAEKNANLAAEMWQIRLEERLKREAE
ncbi:hypothetical protein [Deinococcus alpinitundrae]|uniref:hypothetical protein n=1 Tax=Deinococcus alpinitundrae TaxID=468913 RepID=UPI00137B4CCA|nr:hypothetical protein [Deinococcus alpinitundrae]